MISRARAQSVWTGLVYKSLISPFLNKDPGPDFPSQRSSLSLQALYFRRRCLFEGSVKAVVDLHNVSRPPSLAVLLLLCI